MSVVRTAAFAAYDGLRTGAAGRPRSQEVVQVRIARSALGAVVVGLSLAVLLSACSIRPGAAAVVDGRVISQNELETAQEEIAPLIPGGITPSDILAVLIATPIYVQAAADHGVGVSEADAKNVLVATASRAGLPTDRVYGTGALDMARLSLASSNLSTLDGAQAILAEVQADVAKQAVVVNPRYGTFDPTSGQVSLTEPDWIVPSPTQ